MEAWTDVDPGKVKQMLESGELSPGRIVDVREQEEWEYYHLPGTRHIPMNTIPERLGELDPQEEWYVLCAHGVRSVYVSRYLHDKGYGRIRNITGGIASIALLNGIRYD